MKTAVIYARYSSERQTEQSIEGQLRVCYDFAEKNDIKIVDTYIDRAMTGTNDNRADFQRMLKDSNKRAWDYVLVYKLDRFSRNKYEMAMHKKTLRDNGIKLISAMENIPDTPEGIILESLLEGMAEYYSAELSQKVKRGMNENREKGNFTGGTILYGYKVENKKVVIDKTEASIVKKIYEEFASGRLVTEILDEFNKTGILYRGKNFGRNTLYNFLKKEKYTGRYTFNGKVYTNIYPRIISDELYEIVKNKIESNKYGKHKPNIIYLLKNKIKCGYCDCSVNSDSGTSKSGKISRYYKCSSRKQKIKCKLTAVRKEFLEQLVIDTILSLLANNDLIKQIAQKVIEVHNNKNNDSTILTVLYKERSNTEQSIKNVLSAIDKGITTTSTKLHLEELEQKLENISEQIVIENAKERMQLTVDDIIKYFKIALSKKPKQMIDMLVKEIKLFNDKIEIYFKYNNSIDDNSSHTLYSSEIKTNEKNEKPNLNVKILI